MRSSIQPIPSLGERIFKNLFVGYKIQKYIFIISVLFLWNKEDVCISVKLSKLRGISA